MVEEGRGRGVSERTVCGLLHAFPLAPTLTITTPALYETDGFPFLFFLNAFTYLILTMRSSPTPADN